MNKRKCLNPDCKKPITTRGLCQSCYNIAARLVREGKTTWEQLEKSGKVKMIHSTPRRGGEITKWILGE